MKHASKTFRKTASKSKKFKKTASKRTNKRNKFTKRRIRKGGFTMLENFNLKKYADDEEIQQKLSDHFNEPAIVGNPSKTLSLLKGFNKQYSSIKLLLKEIGVGEQGDTEESKEAISKIIKSNEALQTYQHKAEQRKQFREEQERKKLREQERLEEARKKRREEREREEQAKY